MPTSQMSEVIQHLRKTVLLRDGAGLTDGQLLEDYLSHRNEVALAALVGRHGPMVWGVCRRVLRNHHDAEDAFQATFLVLIRKAASIASRASVGNWLYGVAHQTALKARATRTRRGTRERQVTAMPEPAVVEQDLWCELEPLLDEELSRLPDKYRAVIVLCDLEGKTRKDAARQLGCPEGTVAGWLARGRTMLAKRLTQRGVALAGGALAAVVSQQVASAGVPPSVASSTIKAARLLVAGAAATGATSAKVAALTEGMMKAMFVNELMKVIAVLLVAAALGLAATGLAHQTQAAGQPETAAKEQKEALPDTDENLMGEAELSPLLKTWKERLVVKPKEEVNQIDCVAVSPDGKTIASGEHTGVRLVDAKTGRDKATLLPRPGNQPAECVAFSPDGKLVATGHTGGYLALWDARSGKRIADLKGHSSGVFSVAFSPDGKILASRADVIRLWDVASRKEIRQFKPAVAVDRGLWGLAFSPDGGKLASGEGREVQVRDVSTGKTALTLREYKGMVGHEDMIVAVAYSPDGKRIASGSALSIRIWDAQTGQVQRAILSPTYPGSLAFSPDGKMLASAGGYRNRDVWLNDPTGGALADGYITLAGHTKMVRALAFSPDGSFLATVGDDGLRVWSPLPAKKGQKEGERQKENKDIGPLPPPERCHALHGDRIPE